MVVDGVIESDPARVSFRSIGIRIRRVDHKNLPMTSMNRSNKS
jgi:hypothetical protein